MISLLKYMRPYWKNICAVLILTLSAILLELYLPTLMADVVDIGIVTGDLGFIIKTGAWMIVCSLAVIIMAFGISFFASRAALAFSRDIRHKLFVHVESLSLQEFERIGPASLITRTTNDVRQVQDFANMMLRLMVRAPLMLIGGIVMAVSRDAKLSLVFLGALPLLGGLILLIALKSIPLFNALQKRTDRLNLLIRESLIGVRVVRAFNRVNFEKKRFNEANEQFRDTGIKVNRIIAFTFPIMMIVMNFTSIAIVWFGAMRIDQQLMQVGNLMAFLQYAGMILFSLLMLSMAFIMIPRAQASARRINEVLKVQPAIRNNENVKSVDSVRGRVQFKDVTFRYDGAEKPAVANVSFVAEQGKTTAIIGSTGAGKSTLVRMILRFYDAESGTITIDGTDIKELPLHTLRKHIGYVPQSASLFSGTLADNVRFGKEDASDEEVLRALETAQAMDFVKGHEDGIAMQVEQAGANLSGGQKQRLSIARALVRKPAIYVFDDSFSALDYKTDAKLRQALQSETGDATIILVAQRVSTVEDADQIIVMNEGRIAGIGTHETLLANNEIYQEIVSSQQSKEESA